MPVVIRRRAGTSDAQTQVRRSTRGAHRSIAARRDGGRTPLRRLDHRLRGPPRVSCWSHAARRALIAGGATYWIGPRRRAEPARSVPKRASGRVRDGGPSDDRPQPPGSPSHGSTPSAAIRTTGRAGHATTIQIVVPSTVGSVTLSYRHAAVIARLEGNVLAVTVALGSSAAVHPMTATWRSRSGSVIRVVRGMV